MLRNTFSLAIVLLIACSCSKKIQPAFQESVRYIDREVIKTVVDTVQVTVEIPAQSASVVTPDTISNLETEYAESYAKWSRGLLTHELRNKPIRVSQNVTVPMTEKLKYIEKTDTVKVKEIEYIDKPMNAWNRFRCSSFWWLVSGIVILLLYAFRKPIFRFVKFF